MNTRDQKRTEWLHKQLSNVNNISPFPGDASFRCYFRILTPERSYLLMDAPPALEDSQSFVAIDKAYRTAGIQTPQIFAENLTDGFLLLEDFGHVVLNDVLSEQNAFEYYQHCYNILPAIQACQQIPHWNLPVFVESLLQTELNNFVEWGIEKFAEIQLTTYENQLLQNTFALLKDVSAEQPQVGVHRDFHSRNLMVLPDKSIGIIDFQDAVIGPLTYDLGSLLRDYYVKWPQELVYRCVYDYYNRLVEKNVCSRDQFEYWFDVQGMQRHLKVIFIFARKYLRDNSTAYLKDMLRALEYIHVVCQKHSVLKNFYHRIFLNLATCLKERIATILNS